MNTDVGMIGSVPTGSVSDWAKSLREGQGCYYDGQCQSGWCAHTDYERPYNNHKYGFSGGLERSFSNIKAYTCTNKSLRGEVCENGWDEYCLGRTMACAQYENNNYKCCDDAYIPFGSLSEWCYNLKKGDGCYYDGQCKGNLSCPSECVWVCIIYHMRLVLRFLGYSIPM